MILYLSITAVTVILAYMCTRTERYMGRIHGACSFGSEGSTRAGMFRRMCLLTIFLILALLSSFRLNVGNDYGTYVEFMHRLYTDRYIADPGVPTEWGFNLLARFIYAVSGFENYVLIFAIYAFVTVALFLLAMWEQSEDFAFSFLLFMTFGYYFQSFSTVRYYLALGIALYSMRLVRDRRWISFILIVLLGSGFHKSLLVILPLYAIASFAWKKWHIAVGLALCVSCLFLKDLYLKLLVIVYPSYRDTEYLAGSGFSWINIIRCALVAVLALYCYREAKREGTEDGEFDTALFYFKLNACALALYVFCSFLPVISRIGYYLTVSHILFIPMLVRRIGNMKIRRLIYAAIIAVSLLYFAIYLHKAYDDGVLVLPYRTIFFNEMGNILSDVA